MSVGWEIFISSGADAEIRSRARVVELCFIDQIRCVILYQSLPMPDWVYLVLLGPAWICLDLLRINLNSLCKYAGFSNVTVALPLSTLEKLDCGSIMPKSQYLTVVNMLITGFSLLIIRFSLLINGYEGLLSTPDFRMR